MKVHQLFICVGALSLVLLTAVSPALAQQHVLDQSKVIQALETKQADDSGNRAVVARILQRSDVQVLAERLNLDIRGAQMGVAQLSGDSLADAAAQARALEIGLSGGANTVTISVTTLLLVLLVIILIAD